MSQIMLPFGIPDWAACTLLLLGLWLVSLRHVLRELKHERVTVPRPRLGTHRGLGRPRARAGAIPVSGMRRA